MTDHCGDLCWYHIRGHADDAHGTYRHERKGEGIVARQDFKILWQRRSELVDPFHRAARLFDGANIGKVFCQADSRLDADLDPATTGNAVKDEGDFYGLRDRGEVAIETFLAWLVVIGSHKKGGRCAEFFGSLGEGYGFRGGVGTCSGNDLTASCRRLHCDLDDFEVFLMIQRRGFPSRSDRDNASDARSDLCLDEGLKCGSVEMSVPKWGDECRMGSCE